MSSARCLHATQAGLPDGIPGIELLMLGAMQQAPHFLHSIAQLYVVAASLALE